MLQAFSTNGIWEDRWSHDVCLLSIMNYQKIQSLIVLRQKIEDLCLKTVLFSSPGGRIPVTNGNQNWSASGKTRADYFNVFNLERDHEFTRPHHLAQSGRWSSRHFCCEKVVLNDKKVYKMTVFPWIYLMYTSIALLVKKWSKNDIKRNWDAVSCPKTCWNCDK